MASCMIAPSSIWSFPADADVVEVSTGHVVDPVTFYVIAKDRPAWFNEMEHDLKKKVERIPFDAKLHSGDTVAYWHAKDGKYVRARVEDPYKEMCSGRVKGYIFMIDRGVYATSYIGDRDIVDLEESCRLIPDDMVAANKLPLAHKMRIPRLTPVMKEIGWTSRGAATSYKPTRDGQYTEAAAKFAKRILDIAEGVAMTANYELYLLLPEEIDDQRYRSGLCGRETLVEPGATVNYRDLLIKANFARPALDDHDLSEDPINKYPHPKFPMFTKRRKEPRNGADVSRDVICKKPQRYNWEGGDKEVDLKLAYWFANKKRQELRDRNGGRLERSIKTGEDDEAVERAIRISQPPSLLTMENFNSREEPNPKLEEKMKIWFSHK